MKAALFALSTLLGSGYCSLHFRHLAFHEKRDAPSYPPLEYACCKTVVTVTVYPEATAALPYAETTTCPTPGVYVVPQNPGTITLDHETVLTIQTTAAITPGTNVYGQPPTTTVAQVNTVVVYPVAETFPPGVYTQKQATVTAIYTSQVFVCPYETTTTVYNQQTQVVTENVPAKAAPTPATPAAGIVTNGKKWAMTYTPYRTDGTCKEAGEVLTDVADIARKGFTTLRLYGTDCNGLESVGAAAKANGLKLILGIFIKETGIGGARSQIGDITTWGSKDGNWAHVVMLVVGNEALHDGRCDAGSLAAFISEAKGALSGAGAGGIPVTTTEPVGTLVANKDALCPVIDVVAANIQSFFDGKVIAANAGSFVKSQLDMVAAACPGKAAYNLESGWPSSGNPNGASIPSPENARAAIADIVDKCGEQTVVFSYQDDAWKHPGAYNVEQHFGCAKFF